MDPKMKIILDKLENLGERLKGVEKCIDGVEHTIVNWFKAVEDATVDLNAWKPNIDAPWRISASRSTPSDKY